MRSRFLAQHRRASTPPTGTRSARRLSRSCATNSSPRWRTRAASAPATGWTPRHLLHRRRARRLAARCAAVREGAFLGRVRVRFRLGAAPTRSTGSRYYPKLRARRAVHARHRPAPAACGRTPTPTPLRRAAARGDRSDCAPAQRLLLACTCCSSTSRARRPATAARLAAAPRLPVPLAQPRLRATSRTSSRPSPPRSARRPARAPARRRSGHRLRARCSGATLDAATAATHRTSCMPRTFLRHGHEPYLNARLLPRDRRARCGDALVVKLARARRRAGGGGPLLPVARHAVRPLLGRAPATSTACTSRPATTRASSTASSSGLQRFEPGTQGEHKIARGFVPTQTWSAHWLADPRLARRHRPTTCEREARARRRTTPTRCRDTRPFRARRDRRVTDASPGWRRAIRPSAFPPVEQALRRPAGPAGRRRRPVAASGCSPPTAAASFPGIAPASRCCGGRPIRARCCSRRNSTVSRSLRAHAAHARLRVSRRPRLRAP